MFKCIPGCGLCCYGTEMPLTTRDIGRIARLGYRAEEFVVWGEDGVPRLRNVDGHCVFLDPSTKRCTIYPHRPEGCRLYPLIYVEGEGVAVDPLCPAADTMSEEEIRRMKPRLIRLIKRLARDWGLEVRLDE